MEGTPFRHIPFGKAILLTSSPHLQWALIKEIDESALENPLGDSQESDPVFHITPQDGDDETANLLPLPLDIMASVLNEAHSGLDVSDRTIINHLIVF